MADLLFKNGENHIFIHDFLVLGKKLHIVKSLLKLHNVIILSALFSKTGPPILMKLCM